MKKLISAVLALGMLTSTAYAFSFPTPDWGALLNERKQMANEKDFELYVEGSIENAPYFGAKNEPRYGAYLGSVAENSEGFYPLGSYLTYIQSFWQDDIYYPANNMIKSDDVVVTVGWTVNSLGEIDYDSMRGTLNNLSKYNKPMYIRFGNEMNVSGLGDDPDAYIEAFRTAADIIHEYDNFAVVWSPNDMGALDRPFEYYYPGEEYVDWVGVSCYVTKYFLNNPNGKQEDLFYFLSGPYGWTTVKLKPIIKFMQEHNINKPLMISEGGVERSNDRGDDVTGWHEPRLRNMLWNTLMKYPQVKVINYFNNSMGEQIDYKISGYDTSMWIFNEAANSGAYRRGASVNPDFAFTPANDGGTLTAKNGIVNLYTLAYIPNNPDIYVNYRIDGEWVHGSDSIPYKFEFDTDSVADGEHTLTIDSAGEEKSYIFYKYGETVSFGSEPDISISNQAAEREVTVTVNGEQLEFDQPPVIINDRTLVPMRAIFEALGADVNWDQNTKTATAAKDGITVKFTIDNNIISITKGKTNTQTELDVPPQLISDRTMVPLRAIAEGFEAKVDWDGDTRTVTINE